MAKVTSKLQVTLPKSLAERYKIRPGDEIDWVAAGDVIRVIPPDQRLAERDRNLALRLFDQSTERQRKRATTVAIRPTRNRGWTREDLYMRGRSR